MYFHLLVEPSGIHLRHRRNFLEACLVGFYAVSVKKGMILLIKELKSSKVYRNSFSLFFVGFPKMIHPVRKCASGTVA